MRLINRNVKGRTTIIKEPTPPTILDAGFITPRTTTLQKAKKSTRKGVVLFIDPQPRATDASKSMLKKLKRAEMEKAQMASNFKLYTKMMSNPPNSLAQMKANEELTNSKNLQNALLLSLISQKAEKDEAEKQVASSIANPEDTTTAVNVAQSEQRLNQISSNIDNIQNELNSITQRQNDTYQELGRIQEDNRRDREQERARNFTNMSILAEEMKNSISREIELTRLEEARLADNERQRLSIQLEATQQDLRTMSEIGRQLAEAQRQNPFSIDAQVQTSRPSRGRKPKKVEEVGLMDTFLKQLPEADPVPIESDVESSKVSTSGISTQASEAPTQVAGGGGIVDVMREGAKREREQVEKTYISLLEQKEQLSSKIGAIENRISSITRTKKGTTRIRRLTQSEQAEVLKLSNELRILNNKLDTTNQSLDEMLGKKRK